MSLHRACLSFTLIAMLMLSSGQHVLAQSAMNQSDPSVPSACKVFPGFRLNNAGGTYPRLECKWFPLDDTPALAQVNTSDIRDGVEQSMSVYKTLKESQELWSHRYDRSPEVTRIDKPTMKDCRESKMIIFTKNGEPIEGLVVAHCADLAINFYTLGAVFTKEIEDVFPRIVRGLVADRQKAKIK
jgi:hypothetical protein